MNNLPLHIEKNGIRYTLHGDVYMPDLKISSASRPIGRYSRLHLNYPKEQHPLLILSEDYPRLLTDLNEQPCDRLALIVAQMKEAEGVTEDMKCQDPIAWVDTLNNIRTCAEEIVLTELMYC